MEIMKSSKAFKALVFGALTVCLMTIGLMSSSQDRKESELKSHLTLYVGEPLLSRGGTVIVGAIPIPPEEWRAIEGENPAAEDLSNAKLSELGDQDRLFGAFVYGPVSYVEMYYPEGGTFGFNLVPDRHETVPRRISTERILVGSGGWFNRETGQQHEWPDVSVIYVDGPSANKANSRLVRAYGNNILNLGPGQKEFAGAIVYTPTNDQILEGTFGEYK